MSTRGLLGFRFNSKHYFTYNHSASYPRELGSWVVRFVRDHLACDDAIRTLGERILELKADAPCEGGGPLGPSGPSEPEGWELLEAIAAGAVERVTWQENLFNTALGCEFAYILDLDQGLLEFWELPDLLKTFRLVTIPFFAAEQMECFRRHGSETRPRTVPRPRASGGWCGREPRRHGPSGSGILPPAIAIPPGCAASANLHAGDPIIGPTEKEARP